MKSGIFSIFRLGRRKFFFVALFLFSLLSVFSCVKDHNYPRYDKSSDVEIDILSYATRASGTSGEKTLRAKIVGVDVKKNAEGMFEVIADNGFPNNFMGTLKWFSDIEFTYKDKYLDSENPYKPVTWLNQRRPTYNDDKDVYTAMFAWAPANDSVPFGWVDFGENSNADIDILCSEPLYHFKNESPSVNDVFNQGVCKGNKEMRNKEDNYPKLDFKHATARIRFKISNSFDKEYELMTLKKVTVSHFYIPRYFDIQHGMVIPDDDSVGEKIEVYSDDNSGKKLKDLLGQEIGTSLMIAEPWKKFPAKNDKKLDEHFIVEMQFEEQIKVEGKTYTNSFTYSQKVPYKSPNGSTDIKAGRDCLIKLGLGKKKISIELEIGDWEFEELDSQVVQ